MLPCGLDCHAKAEVLPPCDPVDVSPNARLLLAIGAVREFVPLIGIYLLLDAEEEGGVLYTLQYVLDC